MDAHAFHLEVRNTIVLADELSRWAHAEGEQWLSGGVSALRSSLDELERDLGRGPVRGTYEHVTPDLDAEKTAAVERALEGLLARRDRVPAPLRRRFQRVLASAERISLALWEPKTHVPSKPLVVVGTRSLPIARLVPQDVRSAWDVGASLVAFATAGLAKTPEARLVGMALGSVSGGVTLAGDTRAGLVKRVPIETVESVQIACSAAAIAAPFVLGYARRDPIAAAIHVATGVVGLALALVTDWRGARGIAHPAKRGGRVTGFVTRDLDRAPRSLLDRRRVPEVQRPLEGLSSAQTTWTAGTEP